MPSTRCLVHWATLPDLPPPRWEGRSSAPRTSTDNAALDIARGLVLAALDALPGPVRAWLLIAYGAEPKAADYRQAALALDGDFDLRELVLRQAVARVRGQTHLSDEGLAYLRGISPRAFRAAFGAVWERNLNRIFAWDARGLGALTLAVRDVLEGLFSDDDLDEAA